MISITINADTVGELHRDLLNILAGNTKLTVEEPQPEKPKATRSTNATSSDVKSANVQSSGQSDGPVEVPSSAPTAATTTEVQSTDGDVDLRSKARAVGTKLIDANLSEQLKQVFGEFGATKFPQVPDDKLEAFIIRCEDLLAAVEG